MAMKPERMKSLHNFTMPCSLRWGRQKEKEVRPVPKGQFRWRDRDRRTENVSSGFDWVVEGTRFGESRGSGDRMEILKVSPAPAPSSVIGRSGRKLGSESDMADGIEAMRTKIMLDIQTAADRMKDAILREGPKVQRPTKVTPAEPEPETPSSETVKPWNLRSTRAASAAPNNGSAGAGAGGSKSLNVDAWRPDFALTMRSGTKSSTFQGTSDGAGGSGGGRKREREKLTIPLSQREIAEDFMVFTGRRPARRPKKRARNVQKQIDMLLPGSWLTEVTADDYKVPDRPANGKR